MEAFFGLLASGGLNVASLIAKRCPVEQGSKAYQELKKESGAYTLSSSMPAGRSCHARTGGAFRRSRRERLGAEADRTRETESRLHRRREHLRCTPFSPPWEKPRSSAALGRNGVRVASGSARHDSHAHYVIAGF